MNQLLVQTGLHRLLAGERPELRDLPAGLILHPASVTPALGGYMDVPVGGAEALLAAEFKVRALFGPQHGFLGEKQDNMIESGHGTDPRTGLPVFSLYSETRKPTPEMLKGLELLFFDLQDVGVRVYTFVWTMTLAMEACAEAGTRFVVLDRPNPIGGTAVEGAMLREEYRSFVGLHPIPLRHHLTAGELARYLNETRGIGCELDVLPCRGWTRDMWFDDTGLPWVLPSPNLPTLDSCAVYPGMVLLEGTNLSEGRGTTRPFEIFGAPYLDAYALTDYLEDRRLPGVRFRPMGFEPTFQKHAGRLCQGAQIHVVDRDAFRPVRTAVEILSAVRTLYPEEFAWRPPPYEYEETLMPIDILWGHDGLRRSIGSGRGAEEILAPTAAETEAFRRAAAPYLLY
ncbi:MAG: exo-beta-N-acetylmuramidase NamZ domain-containing protein [Gemmatimonadota bacterium]